MGASFRSSGGLAPSQAIEAAGLRKADEPPGRGAEVR